MLGMRLRGGRLAWLLGLLGLARPALAHGKHHFGDGALIWPHGVVSHLADVNQHYLVYACQVNHTCPFSRYCVVDENFDFTFTRRSNCSCNRKDVQWDRDDHLPGVIRQKRGCELCLHKALWPPDAHDMVGASFLFIASLMSGAVGIGGGGLAVPILVIAMGFHVKEAVPLSHVGVFGSVFAQNLINVPRRHPLTDARPLVDAEVALLLMPCMLLGHSIGVLIGPALPEEWLETIAVIVLLIAAFKTTRSAFKAFIKEVEAGERVPTLTWCAESIQRCGDERVLPADAAVHMDLLGPTTPIFARTTTDAHPPPTAAPTADTGGAPELEPACAESTPRAPAADESRHDRPSTDHILLPRSTLRSDAAVCATADAADDDTAASAVESGSRPLIAGSAAHEELAGDLIFLAHAPRAFVRERLAAAPLRALVDGAIVDGRPAAGHELLGTPPSGDTSKERVVVVVREFPQPVDGGRVLLLLLIWILFAAQYRLDASDWRDAFTGAGHPRCGDDGMMACLYQLLPFVTLRALLYVGILAVGVVAFRMTLASQRQREAYRLPVLPGDMQWTLERTVGTQAMALLVGSIAGLLGLGGGELMAPLLVHLGMLPEVVSAVNAFIIFFTAAADLEHYSDMGVLQLYADTITRPGYVVLAILVSFLGAILGRVGATRLVARFAHPSVLIFLLGVTLLLSAVLLVGRVIYREQQEVRLRSADLACTY